MSSIKPTTVPITVEDPLLAWFADPFVSFVVVSEMCGSFVAGCELVFDSSYSFSLVGDFRVVGINISRVVPLVVPSANKIFNYYGYWDI